MKMILHVGIFGVTISLINYKWLRPVKFASVSFDKKKYFERAHYQCLATNTPRNCRPTHRRRLALYKSINIMEKWM